MIAAGNNWTWSLQWIRTEPLVSAEGEVLSVWNNLPEANFLKNNSGEFVDFLIYS